MTETADRGAGDRAALFYMSAGHALTHVHILLFTALIEPMRASFALDQGSFSRAATASTVLFGVGAIPAGLLSDRIGERPLLVAFFLLTGMGSALVGVASNEALLWMGMAVLGLGTSIYHPVGLAFLSKLSIDPGRAMGVNGFWGSVGTAASPFLAVEIARLASISGAVPTADAWRVSYLVPAIVTIGLGIGFARAKLGSRGKPEKFDRSHGGGSSTLDELPRGMRLRLVLLLAAMMCGGLYFHLIFYVLPSYLGGLAAPGADKTVVGGWLAAVVYLVGAAGQILSGRLLKRRVGSGLYVAVLAVATPLVWVPSILSGVPLVALAGAMSFVIFMVQPIENVLLARYSSARLRGILYAAKFILVFGVGGLGTALGGWVSESYGHGDVFRVASVFTLLAGLFALGAWWMGKASNRARATITSGEKV